MRRSLTAPPSNEERASRRWRRALLARLLSLGWAMSLLAVGGFAGWGLVLSVSTLMSVLAPGLGLAASAPVYQTGTYIDFREGGDGRAYLDRGWAKPGQDGTSTTGLLAGMVLPVRMPEGIGLSVEIRGRPRFAAQDQDYWVDVLADGATAARWQFQRGDPGDSSRVVWVPLQPSAASRRVLISFVVGADPPAHAGADGYSSFEIESFRADCILNTTGRICP